MDRRLQDEGWANSNGNQFGSPVVGFLQTIPKEQPQDGPLLAPLVPQDTGPPPALASYLTLKGKQRWFILECERLSWSKFQGDPQRKKIHAISQVTRVLTRESANESDRKWLKENKCGFILQIGDHSKVHEYPVVAESEDLMNTWLDALEWVRQGLVTDPRQFDGSFVGLALRPDEVIQKGVFAGCLRRKMGTGWQERYFVIADNRLTWYRTRRRAPEDALGCVNIRMIRGVYPSNTEQGQVMNQDIPKGRLSATFFLERPGTAPPLCLLAPSPSMMEVWVHTLLRTKAYLLNNSDECLFDGEADYDHDDQEQDLVVAKARLDTLVSFVPRIVVKRFMKDPVPPSGAEADTMNGAVLFADISGFTALTESLSKKGAGEGAEILCAHLNAYFGKLVELIHLYGGDVIKYAGDALLALWSNGPMWLVSMMATQCALKIQTHTAKYSADNVTLTLHIGIGAGQVTGLHLGGVNDRWEYLIGGEPMLQIAAAEAAAKSGEVVLHEAAWEQVKEHIVARLVPNTTNLYKLEDIQNHMPCPAPVVLDPPLSLEPILRCYIPVVVRKRIDFGLAQWMAELRRVTVMFCSLPDLEFTGKRDQTEKLHATFRCMQQVIFDFDGTVRQFIMDDKGSVLVAAFHIHEDDAVRGIKAALRMITQLKQIGVRSSIGVTTGKVFIGAVGSEARKEFAMVGDTVNLAARLMVAAKGTVLCDNYSYQACQLHPNTNLAFKTLEPIMVKGKKNPIPVFNPFFPTRFKMSNVQRVLSNTQQNNLVGREKERTVLLEALSSMKPNEKSARTIVIEGEEGIGKSQVMRFVRANVQTMITSATDAMERPVVLEVTGDSIHSFSPLYSWQSCLVSQLLDLDQDDEDETLDYQGQVSLQQHVEELLEKLPDWKPYGSLLNELLQIDLAPSEQLSELDGAARTSTTVGLMAALLAHQANGRKVVVLVDDGHWLDAASWAVLLELQKRVTSFLVVVSRRLTTTQAPDFHQLLQVTSSLVLKLSPVGLDDTARILCQVLKVQHVPESLVRLIHDKSNGNPFFMENLAISLRENKIIKISNNTADLSSEIKDPSDIAFPDTVEDVVTSRIGRLPSIAQFVLKVASVIGMQFELQMLIKVYPVQEEKDSIHACIAQLEQLDFLTQLPFRHEATYRFTQAVVRECCYNLLLFQQRRTLHTAIAEWYKEYVDDLRPYYYRLGFHWEMAENFQKAIFYYEKAGDESSRQYATHDAVDFYTKAIVLYPKASNQTNRDSSGSSYKMIQTRLENNLAESFYRLGDMDKASSHLENALKALSFSLPSGTSIVRSALLDAASAVKRNLRMRMGSGAADDQETIQTIRTYELLCHVYYHQGDKLRMLNCAMRAVALASDTVLKAELARAYAAMCVASCLMGEVGDAQKHMQRALDLSSGVPHLSTFARVLYLTSLCSCLGGEMTGTNATLRSVLEMYSRMCQWRKWCEAANLMCHERYFSGEFEDSIDMGDQLVQTGAKHDDYQAMLWGYTAKAKGQVVMGWLNEALDSLIVAERLMGLDQAPSFTLAQKIEVSGLLALVHLRLGHVNEAARYVDVAMASHELPDCLFQLFLVYTDLAEVCFKLWLENSIELARKEAYREHVNRLCTVFASMSKLFPIVAPRCQLRKGQMEWLFGHTKKCRKSWEDAVYWAETLEGVPYEKALVLFEVGTLSENEQEYEDFYSRAVDIFVSVCTPLPPGLLDRDGHHGDVQNRQSFQKSSRSDTASVARTGSVQGRGAGRTRSASAQPRTRSPSGVSRKSGLLSKMMSSDTGDGMPEKQ